MARKYSIPTNDPRILDMSVVQIFDEMMEDIVEAHVGEHCLVEADIKDLVYSDVFPDDLENQPDSYYSIMMREYNRDPLKDWSAASEKAKAIISERESKAQG